jgi:hypothetical protein
MRVRRKGKRRYVVLDKSQRGLSDGQVSRGSQTAEFPPRDDAPGEPVEPTEHDLAIEELSRTARPTRGPGSSRRGESFNFSRQVITHTRRSTRGARSRTAARLREPMSWPIAPTDRLTGV